MKKKGMGASGYDGLKGSGKKYSDKRDDMQQNTKEYINTNEYNANEESKAVLTVMEKFYTKSLKQYYFILNI